MKIHYIYFQRHVYVCLKTAARQTAYNDRKARGCVSRRMIICRVRNLGSYAPGGRVHNHYVLFVNDIILIKRVLP